MTFPSPPPSAPDARRWHSVLREPARGRSVHGLLPYSGYTRLSQRRYRCLSRRPLLRWSRRPLLRSLPYGRERERSHGLYGPRRRPSQVPVRAGRLLLTHYRPSRPVLCLTGSPLLPCSLARPVRGRSSPSLPDFCSSGYRLWAETLKS